MVTKLKPHICEVKVGDVWCAVSLGEAALRHLMATKRCPACHGQVMILGAYGSLTVRRTMSHRRSHSGCPLKSDTYTGTPSPHPQALT